MTAVNAACLSWKIVLTVCYHVIAPITIEYGQSWRGSIAVHVPQILICHLVEASVDVSCGLCGEHSMTESVGLGVDETCCLLSERINHSYEI